MDWIASNLQRVRERVAASARRAGRDPGAITLVAVTKGVAPALIRAAVAQGITHLGENRIQEAAAKRAALADLPALTWHLIGHLQMNKTAEAAVLFRWVHSVDSARLAQALDRRATAPLDTLIQVNISGESTKFGVEPPAAAALARELQALPHLAWRGLMTMAPLADDPEAARPVFRRLRELRDALAVEYGRGDLQLSMGMSHDFTVAIEEGADLVRIGSAIFQEHYWDDVR